MSQNRKELLANKSKCRIIQIDEMHTWIERREQKLYIALAVSGYGQILSLGVEQIDMRFLVKC